AAIIANATSAEAPPTKVRFIQRTCIVPSECGRRLQPSCRAFTQRLCTKAQLDGPAKCEARSTHPRGARRAVGSAPTGVVSDPTPGRCRVLRSTMTHLPRLHAFEFEDQSWLPDALRDGVTDYLQHCMRAVRLYHPAAPIIARLVADGGEHRIVDLCSGAGGPWLGLLPELRAAGCHAPI